MIQSMTGYGKAQFSVNGKNITIEIRSLNSKQADLNLRIPFFYREKENEIRSLMVQHLERGKIDLMINSEFSEEAYAARLNLNLAKMYFEQLHQMADILSLDKSKTDFVSLLTRMPDVLKPADPMIPEEEWELLMHAVQEALQEVIRFRKEDGISLTAELTRRTHLILDYLIQVESFENERKTTIRDRILKELTALPSSLSFDKNRFEQEMIYWLEKMDFSEEKSRLRKHCDHFVKTLSEEGGQGKKLGFIAQEMGREINTLGSKANHADIQRFVVEMKDELEKVKEQLLNIL